MAASTFETVCSAAASASCACKERTLCFPDDVTK
ncbi:hypothetical protein HID58_087972 [Brassica napus]|uniref:Uncharacterized protein n=1 Tax=Brassica napus TaxID=3708 RepID=A0ABQ7XUW8_BRANA|nr:hypothetical protein HID58_087972 [Brassica napus]